MARPRTRHHALALWITFPRRRIHDLLPVLPVAILNHHRDWRAQGLARAHAGQELDVVGLDLHSSAAAIALLASRQLYVDVSRDERQSGDHAFEYRDEGGTVRFARGGKSEHRHPKRTRRVRLDNPWCPVNDHRRDYMKQKGPT